MTYWRPQEEDWESSLCQKTSQGIFCMSFHESHSGRMMWVMWMKVGESFALAEWCQIGAEDFRMHHCGEEYFRFRVCASSSVLTVRSCRMRRTGFRAVGRTSQLGKNKVPQGRWFVGVEVETWWWNKIFILDWVHLSGLDHKWNLQFTKNLCWWLKTKFWGAWLLQTDSVTMPVSPKPGTWLLESDDNGDNVSRYSLRGLYYVVTSCPLEALSPFSSIPRLS